MAEQKRLTRAQRQERARDVAAPYDGIAHRRDLRAVGITREDVRTEVRAGRWLVLGKHTVVIRQAWSTRAAWFHALWETGSGAVLDGVAALHASGLTGFQHHEIDVALPTNNRRHKADRTHIRHYRTMPPTVGGGVPRVRPEIAALNAAQWALTDRMAALILCLVVGQGLVLHEHLLETFARLQRCRRRAFLTTALKDICAGAASLGELDFARLCREYGLPPPSRQVLRTLPTGRAYLDVRWDDINLVVEIDGGHHTQALAPLADALRQNEIVLTNDRVLRIPLLGLRLDEEAFMGQVVRAHRQAVRR